MILALTRVRNAALIVFIAIVVAIAIVLGMGATHAQTARDAHPGAPVPAHVTSRLVHAAPQVTCSPDYYLGNIYYTNNDVASATAPYTIFFQLANPTNYCLSNYGGTGTWTQAGTGLCLYATVSDGDPEESTRCSSVYAQWAMDSGSHGTRLRNPFTELCIWDDGTNSNASLSACSATDGRDNYDVIVGTNPPPG